MTTHKLLTLALVAIAAATLLTGCDVPKGACVYRMGSGNLASNACVDDFTKYQCENGAGTMVAWYADETCADHGY